MNCASKLNNLKTLLGIDRSDTSQDALLTVYLDLSRQEIINWMYINYPSVPDDFELPDKYSTTQVQAVVTGLNMQGGENQDKSNENGVVREWHYTDMLEYIRAHVNQIPRVG